MDVFVSRNPRFRRRRCEQCRLPTEACLCDFFPKLRTHIHFDLIVHAEEFDKPTSTGHLLTSLLPATKEKIWSRPSTGEVFWKDPDVSVALLFPSPQSMLWKSSNELNSEHKDSKLKTEFCDLNVEDNQVQLHSFKRLILLDGTWKQCRRMVNGCPNLKALPAIRIEPSYTSRFRLRKQNSENNLSTIEVAIEILRLAGEYDNARSLWASFMLFQEAYLCSKFFQPLEASAQSRWETFFNQSDNPGLVV